MLPKSPFRLLLAGLAVGALLLASGCSPQRQAQSHRERANAFFLEGDYERARLEYRNLLRLAPGDLEAIQRLAIIFQDEGAVLHAAPLLVKAVQLDPGNAEMHARLGKAYLAGGDLKKALEESWAALDLDPGLESAVLLVAEAPGLPDDLESRRVRLSGYREKTQNQVIHWVAEAVFAIRRQDTGAAQEALGAALKLDDQLVPAHFLQASLYEAATNVVEADREFKRAAELSPVRSIRRVRYAEFKLRQDKPQEAKQLLAAQLKEAPGYLPAIFVQAQIAFAERHLDEALAGCTALLERYPLHLDAALLRSRIRLLRDEAATSLEELGRLARIYGQVPLYQFQLAVVQLGNREPNGAIATLEKLLKVEPAYADAVVLLARLNLQLGRAEPAIRGLSEFVQAHPDNRSAQLVLADAFIANRQLDQALAVYRDYEQAVPQDPRGPFLVGLVLRQQNQLAAARKSYEQALVIESSFLAATVQLVELDLADRKLDAALTRAEGVVEQAPQAAGAHLLLARVQIVQTNLPAAESTLEKVIELDPSQTGAYLMLAGIYRDSDRLVPALQRLGQLLVKTPNDVRALMLKATVHSELGQTDQARDAYEVLLTVDPNFSPALNNLAYLHTELLPDLDKAWRYARRARELLPDSPEAADTLGWVHFRRGEYQDALRMLVEAAEKLPAQPELQYHLGMTYYMMAQEGPARVALERAVQSSMEFQGKDEARRRLELLALDTRVGGADIIRRLESQLEQEPGDVFALVRLADVQLQEGDLKAAQGTLERALNANPNLPQALVTQARLKAESGQGDEALALIRRARLAAAGDSEVAWHGGQVALECDDVVLALALLQEAAQRTGDRPDVLADLARATYLSGRVAEAQRLAQQVIQLNPGAGALNRAKELDWCIQAYGNPASAAERGEATLSAMLARDPANVPAQLAFAGVQVQKARYVQARDIYEQVLTRLPGLPQAHRELALLYAGNLRDDTKAYDHALKARQALGSDPVVAKVLGLLTYRRGDLRYAEQLLQEAAKSLSDDPEIQQTLKAITDQKGV